MHQEHKDTETQNTVTETTKIQVWSPIMTTGLEMEWDYPQRKR